jgi:hypothetical protein
MNAPVRPSPDLPRRLFTTQDVFRMVEAGVMQEDENVELIEGELVVMAAGRRRAAASRALAPGRS